MKVWIMNMDAHEQFVSCKKVFFMKEIFFPFTKSLFFGSRKTFFFLISKNLTASAFLLPRHIL